MRQIQNSAVATLLFRLIYFVTNRIHRTIETPMPEGDTIHRVATNLRKVLAGQRVTVASHRRELDVTAVNECTIDAIESRGKHLIIHFDNDSVLHSHLGMTGSWHIYRIGGPWQKPKHQAAAVFETHHWTVVCFTPKLIELVTTRQLARNKYLQKLGPDILGPPISDEVFLGRIRTQNVVAIGEAIMNQMVICGIGNIYKSETLFLESVSPQTRVKDLSDEQLCGIRDRAVLLMTRNLNNERRKTRFNTEAGKLWVYGRKNEDCLQCGNAIKMLRQGDTARSTYYCCSCQIPETNSRLATS